MKKSSFELHLEEELKDPAFAERYRRADEALDIALRIVEMREKAGLSQRELAKLAGTTQQQISRLESASYEGHSVRMLRRIAGALNAEVRVTFEPTRREKVTKRAASRRKASNSVQARGRKTPPRSPKRPFAIPPGRGNS